MIASGEGGMMTTNNKKIAERFEKLKNPPSVNRPEEQNGFSEISLNHRLSNLHAAVGLAQLERLEKNLPVRTDKEPVVDELANTIIDQWNDRELESKDETVDETAYWFFENLKSKTLNRIADITLVNG